MIAFVRGTHSNDFGGELGRRRRAGVRGLCLGVALTAFASVSGTAQGGLTSEMEFLGGVRDELAARIADHRGVVGFYVVDPNSAEAFGIGEDLRFPSSSLATIPVMVDVFHRVGEGRILLEDPLTLLRIDKNGGPGLLKHMSTPMELTVWDALFLMITLSDHTATNLLVEKLRPRLVTERMRALGLVDTQLFMPADGDPEDSFAIESAREFGMGVSTPREMAELLAMLYQRQVVQEDASDVMIGLLQQEFHEEGIRRAVPYTVPVAHKTAATEGVRSDCGIVFGSRRDFILCTMTRANADPSIGIDQEPFLLISEVARIVYEATNGEGNASK